ncbi:amino acid transporter AVT1I-like [Patiria miniata]|uniref:Amino acid transporter transmembrane domain-containing protein n=1 Tax=Patiria miniata TaxID=46514 RepID=A0A914BCJ8_PATMI|nr:amino acid transporter AVT1I-like [Patiria miniata]XP_038073955.1 amino acid transporter AVT1I-like [Patiria miniata]
MAESTDGQTLRLIERSQHVSTGNTSGDEKDTKDSESSNADGINMWQTAVSISGICAGLGFLAVDVLVVSTGWVGFLLFGLLYAALLYTSIILGRCWNMVRAKWGSERHPYGAIGQEAFGDWARGVVNVLVAVACFTNAIVFLMGFTEMTLTIGGPALEGTLCYWPPVFGVIICPFLWLATPKNFWLVLAGSFFTVVLSVIFVIISIFVAGDSMSKGTSNTTVTTHGELHGESDFLHLAEVAGTVFWLMGQHSVIPTLQQDMQQPQGFTKAIIIADLLTLFLALPMMLVLLIIFGDTLTNVTGTAIVFDLLPEDALKKVAALLILVHLAGGVLLVNNPLFQYLEEVLNIPTDFSWKRVVLRSSVLLGQIFVQETLPHFTLLSSISGGFLTPILALIVPCLCYLRLRRIYQEVPSKLYTLETVVCVIIIGATPCLIGAILFGTGTAIVRGKTAFTVPCYVNATQARL